jgi:hypothetical protein
VIFEIDDSRIQKLAEKTLRRAFTNEFMTKARLSEDGLTKFAIEDLFNFYVCYVRCVRLLDELAVQGLACAPIDLGCKPDYTTGNLRQVRKETGEIRLLIPKSIRDGFSDSEIVGMVAHELGHLRDQFHYGAALDVYNGDKTVLEGEREADEMAIDLGFEKEIEALRIKIPLADGP